MVLLLITSLLTHAMLHRWPFPSDVMATFDRNGVDIHALRAVRPEGPSQAWRVAPAPELERRLRFLGEALGKSPPPGRCEIEFSLSGPPPAGLRARAPGPRKQKHLLF